MAYNPYSQLPRGLLDEDYLSGFSSRPLRTQRAQGQPDFSANEMPSGPTPSERFAGAVNEGGAFSRGSMRSGPANAGALGTWRPTAPSLKLAGPTTVRKDYDAWRAAGGGSIDGRAVTGNSSVGYSGGGGMAGGYGGVPGGSRRGKVPEYGTGPRRPRHYPEGLGDNPSMESLAAAALNDYERNINEHKNYGAGGRIEDVMAAGRSNAANAYNQAGYGAGSLAAIQGISGGAINAADQASGREAALGAQYARERLAGRGDLAGQRRRAGDAIFGQFSEEQRLRMAQEAADLQAWLASQRR